MFKLLRFQLPPMNQQATTAATVRSVNVTIRANSKIVNTFRKG